ncbi:MAG TPA: glutamate ABC transporter substrate-binding protein [Streptosporangiaceae bacterium]
MASTRLVTALAAALLTSACAGSGGAALVTFGTSTSVTPPEPPGVTITTPSGLPANPACNPVASYRPPASMPVPGAMPPGSTMAAIRAHGTLVVGVDENTYLFGYLNLSDGQVEGFDIDIANAVAAAIFGATGHVQLKVITVAQRIPDLLNGSVDIVVDTMTENCARWRQIDFSTEYYSARQRVLVKTNSRYQSLTDLGGRKVCADAGSTSIATIARAASHPIPVSAQGITDCLVMLEQGQVDAVSTDDSLLAGLAAQDPHTHMVGSSLEAEPYGIGIAPNHLDLVRFVNGVLAQLRADGGWSKLYQKWPGRLGGPVPSPPAAVYRD